MNPPPRQLARRGVAYPPLKTLSEKSIKRDPPTSPLSKSCDLANESSLLIYRERPSFPPPHAKQWPFFSPLLPLSLFSPRSAHIRKRGGREEEEISIGSAHCVIPPPPLPSLLMRMAGSARPKPTALWATSFGEAFAPKNEMEKRAYF